MLVLDEIQRGELSDLVFVDVRIKRPVKSLQRGDLGEVRAFNAPLYGALGSGINLVFKERAQPVQRGRFLLGSQYVFKLGCCSVQPQCFQLLPKGLTVH